MDLQKLWRKSSTKAPPEYIDYILCKTFGWTPQELDAQDNNRINTFLQIMNLEAEEKERKQKKRKENKFRPRL